MGVWPMLLVLVLTAASTTSSTTASPTTSPAGEEQILLTEMRAAIVVNQLLLQQLHAALPQPEPSCPYPYTRVLDECFYVTKKKLSWYKARQHCLGMNGDLATPKHLHALVSHVYISKSTLLDVWVGGRRQNDGVWHWLNNVTVNDQDWYSTLPEARPTFECLYIHVQSSADQGPLANWSCTKLLGFACKMKSQA